MLPVCGKQIGLVRTYRYPLASWEWALPRGYAHGEDTGRSARIELAEELGREPDNLTFIGIVTPNSGVLASHVELFVAHYETVAIKPMDPQEIAKVKWITLKKLYNEITAGQIKDAFTLSALACAQARGLIAGPH
jgi:8-oxo-dGTP pyrophosphatase MutT (NUDIX family)